jgi:hypothetical protein
MKIRDLYSYSETELIDSTIDFCIVASGYESRSCSLAKFLSRKENILQKMVWGFKEYHSEKSRLKNDEIFKSLSYHFTTFSGSDSVLPYSIVKTLLGEQDGKERLTFLIDVSAMSRTWYGAIIRALAEVKYDIPIRTIFAYTPAIWKNEKYEYPPIEVLAPLPGYSSHALPNKPTALIIGLGQEDGRALGLKEHLDPQKYVCFYTSPGIDQHYEDEVIAANSDLLEKLDLNCRYAYNIYDTFGSYKMLESVCNGLIRDYRIVLASMGPKIFGIYCFLLATAKPEISVWRVSSATSQKPIDQKPSKERILFRVDWE